MQGGTSFGRIGLEVEPFLDNEDEGIKQFMELLDSKKEYPDADWFEERELEVGSRILKNKVEVWRALEEFKRAGEMWVFGTAERARTGARGWSVLAL